jgi:peptidyl-dipeptidase Dcp
MIKDKLLIVLLILSGMTTGFSQNEVKETNPLLVEWNTPHQTPPFQEIKHAHFIPAIDATLAEAKKEVDAIINSTDQPTFQNTIVALEICGENLERATSVLFNLNSAETDDEIQAITREVSPKL